MSSMLLLTGRSYKSECMINDNPTYVYQYLRHDLLSWPKVEIQNDNYLLFYSNQMFLNYNLSFCLLQIDHANIYELILSVLFKTLVPK